MPGTAPTSATGRQRQVVKTTPSSRVADKIEPRATTQKRTATASRSSTAKTSDTTFEVRGRASGRKTDRATQSNAASTQARASRAKVIEVDKATGRSRIKRVTSDGAPETSSASRVVERKTARRSASSRTGSTRGGSKETVVASVETTPDTRSKLRSPRATTLRNTNTTVAATSERGHRRSRRSDEPAIVINGDNNVVVQGDVTTSNTRPHISTRRLCHDISYVHYHDRWESHSGFYFSFAWSSSSCGRVAYLPYRYQHSWCHYPVYYGYPYYYGLSYYYPRYHRKYIYVSIGGYWPSWYRYRRYYWYGCHPYYWYGAYVITEPYQNVTYNTYNYYNDGASQTYYTPGGGSDSPADEPEFESISDLCFAHAVELFEAQNYDDALLQFREAISLSPDDIVLPFTYSQALFANGDYAHAAGVLREAIAQIPEDELTVYYPRGLYKDETILTKQIEQLEAAVDEEPFDSDYQLLLGYQYLGIGELDKAHQPLTEAARSTANVITAGKLLDLAAKLETESTD
ncbi:MAG: tetratricopeptide repeat protein [Planctomycetota bacterium]